MLFLKAKFIFRPSSFALKILNLEIPFQLILDWTPQDYWIALDLEVQNKKVISLILGWLCLPQWPGYAESPD